MSRVKRGTIKNKRRRNVLQATKGYRFGRSTKERQAKEAIRHAGAHAFAHRKDKKADRRRLWQTKINAAVRSHGLTYSIFINLLKKANINVDRKVLANVAETQPSAFARFIEKVKS